MKTVYEKNEDMRNQELQERIKHKLIDQNRLEKIITIYLEKLQKQLKEKKLLSFFLTDKFEKITSVPFGHIQKLLVGYENRPICHVTISPNHKYVKKEYADNIWLLVTTTIFHIGTNCIIKKIDHCDIIWQANDFLTTKFTFTLLDTIIKIVLENKYNYTCVPKHNIKYGFGFIRGHGYTISYIKRDLQIKGYDISKTLTPLAT